MVDPLIDDPTAELEQMIGELRYELAVALDEITVYEALVRDIRRLLRGF